MATSIWKDEVYPTQLALNLFGTNGYENLERVIQRTYVRRAFFGGTTNAYNLSFEWSDSSRWM